MKISWSSYVLAMVLVSSASASDMKSSDGRDNAIVSTTIDLMDNLQQHFSRNLGSLGKLFAGQENEDSNGALRFLMDQIENDMNNYFTKTVVKELVHGLSDASKQLNKVEGLYKITGIFIGLTEDSSSEGSAAFKKRIVHAIRKLSSIIETGLPEIVLKKVENVTSLEKLERLLIRKLSSPEAIAAFRKYVQNLPEIVKETDLGKDLVMVNDKLNDEQLMGLVKALLTACANSRQEVQTRGIFDIFEKIKEFFKSIGSAISSKFSAFKDWAADHWNSALSTIKEHVSAAAALAKEFISHAGEVTKAVAKQALQYFKDHKSEIAKAVFKHVLTIATTALLSTG